jgi:tetratricopeptide (TPR) repeat protein
LADKEVAGLSDDLTNTNFTDLAIDSLKQFYFQPAVDRIDTQFQDMPLVRARLLDTLARAMAEQGAWELAETVQKKSLDIWEMEVGKNDIRYWRSMAGLADIDGKNSNYRASYEKLALIRDNLSMLVGEDDLETIQTTSQLAYALQMNGDTAKALELHQTVQAWIESHPETEPQFKLAAADNLAQSLDLAGRTTEAITTAQKALAAVDKNDPTLQKSLIVFLVHYATILNETAKIGKPIEQTTDQLFGKNSGTTLHGQAQKNLEAALEMASQTYGEEHPLTLEINNQLAIFKTFWLDWSYGVKFFEKALTVHERVLGRNHLQTLGVINRLGESHFHLKQFDLAIKRQQEAYDGFETILGPDHSITLSVKASIGVNLRDKGDPQAAYEILNDVYTRGLKDSSYQSFRQQLAQTCIMLKKTERVKEIVQEQLKLSAERFEKGTFDHSTDLTFCWSSLMYIGAWEEAEPILRETVDIMMQLKPDHHETYDRQSTYGECLVKLKRFAEADHWLVEGHAGLTRLRSKLPHRWEDKLGYATDRFIEFYAEQGNQELADRWRQRLKEFEESRRR